MTSSTPHGARARARIEVTAAIKDEARRQLAAEGAVKLSLRAVARELGMVSSAVYRYFPSRDELLTALIIDAYDSLGAAAEAAHDEVADAGPVQRWMKVCEAVRGWALAHPHEYALIYGSPVPGYTAPRTTVPPAARVGHLLIAIVRDAHQGLGLAKPRLAEDVRPEAVRMAADLAPDLPPEAVVTLVAAWAQLYGLVGFEVFGQFTRIVEEREPFFRHAVGQLAHTVGLVYPQEGRAAQSRGRQSSGNGTGSGTGGRGRGPGGRGRGPGA
ncbi:TetR/AcrR family transcriptional regulator [Streptomyces chromofuscus]|uniref:TetR/AcrR family transcriptional regulator n=1 Tax=Streptomyces chromofuscus TaxID=42881 RepID=A0A7M2TAI3_STRCW|nr:TetR/AcrR family transcriptional regulator [Streptomyces chromofuscus]QOV45234.1 TetR/AcrR family transcriptional regulator [Streptomyces chromofuscus]GGS99275.1 TetR family transcriptional regulator [Streptomyces chromofuscus]